MTYFLAFACVLGIAAGQLVFKLCANSLELTGSYFHPDTFRKLAFALVLYGVTTLGWIAVLQKAELGKIYPVMTLAFVLVPLGSHLLFGEQFSKGYFAGLILICTGIIVITRS